MSKKTFGTFCELIIYLELLLFLISIPVSFGLLLFSWTSPFETALQVVGGLTFGSLSLVSMIFSFILIFNERLHLKILKRSMKRNEKLNIMTYNLNYEICSPNFLDLNDNTQKVIDCIKESNCDIVFLQETHEGFEELFKEHLSTIYPFQYYQHGGTWIAGGMGVMSKSYLNIKNIKIGEEKSFYTAMIAENEHFEILNVHLTPPLRLGQNSHFAMENLKLVYLEAPKTHRKELTSLLNSFETLNRRIVLGDFNDSGLSDWMYERNFIDTLIESDDKITWYWPLSFGLNLWSSYDHIFHTRHFCCESCRVETKMKHVSDHLPLIATLSFNKS
jgi:endonuclease/exonuclease/phosphatase family metal-dependent hydrolase